MEKCKVSKRCRNCQHYRPSIEFTKQKYCKLDMVTWRLRK